MQALLLALSRLGWTLDLILFVLDLNYWLVSSLISFLFWILYFVFSLPGTITLGLQNCWEYMLVCLAIIGEFCCNLVLGTVQATEGVFKGFTAGLHSLQLLWNLLCHSVSQCKDTIQGGLLNILSGQTLHQQFSELLIIAVGLVAYTVNTLVNLSIIVVENILSAVLPVWLSLLHLIFTSKEFIILLFSQLSSTVVAVTMIVWAPFQMAVDVLVSCSTAISMFKHLYQIIILLFLIWGSHLMLMPSPALRFLCEKLSRVYQIVLVLLCLILNSDVWRRVAERSFQLFTMYRAAWDRDINQRETQNASIRMAGAQNYAEPTQRHNASGASQQNSSGLPNLHENSIVTPVRHCSASTSRENEVPENLRKLLKQQEERRKCVICQDETKTVLLLPCRHLCLCNLCTQILLQQPILQRNCPLCRQMILQTLNVYM